MAYAIVNNCVITLRERQLSVLATCSVFHAQFMTYAHIKIGKEVGLSSEQAYDARTGKTPQGLSEEETVAYDFSLALASATGPVKDEIWEKTKNCIGKEKVTALVHVVGLYTYTRMLMSADDVPVSDGEKIES
jgi:4-carboxymuconolactone decarboxylase